MKINIVRPTDGWVLQKIAEAWQLPGSVCSSVPDPEADVNIWCNYALFHTVGHLEKTKFDIAYFTHREPEHPLSTIFDFVAAQADHCIAMCDKTAAYLPSDRTTVIHTAPGIKWERDITLGVVGRDYPRKRTHLLQQLEAIPGITTAFTGGKLLDSGMPHFYKAVDYIVVLSENEGGPMCVPEAMAMGKPVIAPDVGWCWDYPVIRYGDAEDLLRVVKKLIPPTIEEESAAIMEVVRKVTG